MLEKLVIPDSDFEDKILLFLMLEVFLVLGQIFSLYAMNKTLISFLNIYESNIIAFVFTLGLIFFNYMFIVNFMPDKKRGN